MPPDREPTRDELLAMAYADGELGDDRQEFETRLASEPALARQVAEHQALQLLARTMAPPEPADFEWNRLAADPTQQLGQWLGWVLLAGGSLGLGAWGVWGILTSEMELLPKSLLVAAIAGGFLLLVTTARARLRVLPSDPYRKVQR